MELMQLKENLIVTYQRQGNNKNGNPIYIVNFFQKIGDNWVNINYSIPNRPRLDKYCNFRLTSYNIEETVKYIGLNLNL